MKAVVLAVLLSCAAQADQLSETFDALKRAEAAKNASDVLRLAQEVSRLARIEIAAQLPPDVRNEYQKERAVYLSQTDTYTEYSMAVSASYPGTSAGTMEQLIDAIAKQNRTSAYLELAVPPYLNVMASNPALQLQAAQKIVSVQSDNEDALLVLADATLQAQQYDAASRYAMELLAVMAAKSRPERYSEEAWRAKKTQLSAHAHFNAGVVDCSRQAWQSCDVHMRTVQGDAALAGAVNFYLGWANYQIAKSSGDRAKMEEALKFSQQAAAIAGPTQGPAQQNAAAIQQELKR